jgi:cytochrome P450
MTTEVLRYRPFGRDTWRDPYTLYRDLLEHDPVQHVPDGGYWVLSRFADVFAAARDTTTFSSEQGLTFQNEIEAIGLLPNLVMMDPPQHTTYRRLVARGFTPRQVSALEPALRRFVRRRVERLVDAGRGDFVELLARPVPCFVVAQYLGVPESDRDRFEGWTEALVQAGAGGHEGGASAALAELYQYFSEQITARRADPGEDLISDLARLGPDEVGGATEDILGYAFVMVAGGNDTATGLLGGAAELLTRHPEQRRRLLDDPSRVPAAVEESLRLVSPVQGLCRVTTRDVDVDGVALAAGSRVLLCYGAANRDPREFGPTADDFDVTRRVARLLTFGSGAHFCLGAAAARLQGRVVLEELLRAAPAFAVDADAGVFADGAFTRRYVSLPCEARAA